MTNELSWSYVTLFLCFAGWATHWLSSWGEQWRLNKASLKDYYYSNVPAFWFSVIATAALYVVGPGLLPLIGLNMATLPGATATAVANLGALTIGYMADSMMYKIANLVRKVEQ
jgi:hypothetical protein